MSEPSFNVVLSLFDESSTFMGSLGRYSGGGSKYERSIYNDLFNGSSSFNRALTKASYNIVNPRLNICLLGHATEFIQYMREERANKDDGLIQRILCSAPLPKFYSMEIVKEARNSDKAFSIAVFFYIIHRFHKRKILDNQNRSVNINLLYIFDDDAAKVFNSYYSEYKSISQRMNNIDNFIV